ncbi:MAG: hypothetical protein K2X41_10870 [Hyphomicrobium sp.]|nr:hypothetical protein [Hyphomicrobium sp.]
MAPLLAILMAAPVRADETGFADMHNVRKERGRICMSDHYHYGSGTGATKQAALAAAIQAWSSFTDFEYGSTWASFKRATGKSVSYSASSGGWSADISARACK